MINFKLKEGVEKPKYETEGASGADVRAYSIMKVFKGDVEVLGEKLEKMRKGFEERGYIKIRAFERVMFGSGIVLTYMDKALEIQVRNRSGVALKRGLSVFNSPGTVDADYRGEIGIIIYNSSPFLTTVEKGERIAQIVPSLALRTPFTYSEDFVMQTETKRGKGGFGSTGTHS